MGMKQELPFSIISFQRLVLNFFIFFFAPYNDHYSFGKLPFGDFGKFKIGVLIFHCNEI